MVKLYPPASIAAPASRYSHGAEAGPNARWLHISGQVGTNTDGSIAAGFEAQTHRVWQNTLAVLEDDNGCGQEIFVDPALAAKAMKPLTRMLDFAAARR